MNKKKELKSTDFSKKPEELKLNNKWNWRSLKEKRGLKKLALNIKEFKLRDKNNMNNMLLKEKLNWKLNVENKKS